MSFKSFEEIEAWKKGRVLVNEIYEITKKNNFEKDFALKDQIRRAAISIIANISEGYERDGNKEFINFLSISKASTGEVRSLLYIAKDQKYISDKEFDKLTNNCSQVSKMNFGLMNYLRQSQVKGVKYK